MMLRRALLSRGGAQLSRSGAGRGLASYTPSRTWNVYLSGEIHSDWREVIAAGVEAKGLPVALAAPNTVHEDSDDCGAIILGDEEKRPNYDSKGARMNLIRTRTLLEDADVVVVRFGDKYRQWNAAFDAGYATARGKALVTLHPPGVSHMLKEVGRKRRKRPELRTSGRIEAVSARVRTSRVRSPSARLRVTRIDSRASARVEVGPERSASSLGQRGRARGLRGRGAGRRREAPRRPPVSRVATDGARP